MAKKTPDLHTKRKCANLILNWCRKNLGINRYRKTKPKVSVRINFPKDETERFIKGAYYAEENRIIVYHINVDSIEMLVQTIIHEYTHYLQSDKKYWDYFKTHYYSSHPYERQAERNELKYTDQCLCDILGLLD